MASLEEAPIDLIHDLLVRVLAAAGTLVLAAAALHGDSTSPNRSHPSLNAHSLRTAGPPEAIRTRLGQRPLAFRPDSGLAVDAPLSSTAPSSRPQHSPVRLKIPRLQLNAAVEEVGVDQQGNMDVPGVAANVGWFSPGPTPGEEGDAVIAGHLDWYTGPAVFQNLGRLQPGDTVVVVADDGSELYFRLTDSKRYPYSARPPGLFETTGPPRLSLITCTGVWNAQRQTYEERLVLTAELLEGGS